MRTNCFNKALAMEVERLVMDYYTGILSLCYFNKINTFLILIRSTEIERNRKKRDVRIKDEKEIDKVK